NPWQGVSSLFIWWMPSRHPPTARSASSLRLPASSRASHSGQAPRQPEAGHHGDDKHPGLPLQAARQTDGRPGTDPRQAPADAEDQRPADQARIYGGCRHSGQLGAQYTATVALTPEEIARCKHRQGPTHHQYQAGIPGSEQVEEAQYLGRVYHARDHQAKPEQGTGQQRNQRQHNQPPKPSRVTVVIPAAINTRVATMERGD